MDLSRTTVIRSHVGRIGFWISCAVAVVALVMTFAQGGFTDTVQALPLLLLVVLLAAIFWWLPYLAMDADGLVIANPFRTTRIGWGAIVDASPRLGVTVTTARGKHRAWAAPAKSSARREDQHHLPRVDQIGAGEFDLDAYDAVALMNRFREEHPSGSSEVTVRWEYPRLVAVAVVLLGAAAAIWL